MRDKSEVYNRLVNEAFWYRSGGPPEEGHTFFYRPHAGIARAGHADPERQKPGVVELRNEFAALYGVAHEPVCHLALGQPVPPLMHEAGRGLLVFEGYAFNSLQEGRDQYESTANVARGVGWEVLLSSPTAADHWNHKPSFLAECRGLFGPEAVAPAWELQNASAASIASTAGPILARGRRVIVKESGAGGFSNLILSPGDDVAAKLAIFHSRTRMDKAARWTLVEEWVPWMESLCCSFFLTESDSVHMELCGQVLSPATAGFIGGKSFHGVQNVHAEGIARNLRPLFERMREQGVRGFAAVDLIICDPDYGGLKMMGAPFSFRLIECNARLNGHNQERLAVELLARRDGIDRHRVRHLRVGNKPVAGTASRAQVQSFFSSALEGLAAPVPLDGKLARGEAYFVLDVNHGETAPSVYDGVMFVGADHDAEPKIELAFEHLHDRGLLKV